MPTSVKKQAKTRGVKAGATPADDLMQAFPSIRLPIRPPYPPAEAKSVARIPKEPGWLYEPKWDGFRCLAYRRDKKVLLQSKAGQPLGRYFPELLDALAQLEHSCFVLDGEIVIKRGDSLSFDDLLMRVHPAESRIRRLSLETPATLMSFDLLVDEGGENLTQLPLSERRSKLEKFFRSLKSETILLSLASTEEKQAERWMHELGKMGLDGIVAKQLDQPYHSGERTGMVKIKRIRAADCVVGGFRYAEKGGGIGSLLLGLYDEDGLLNHVGFTSSFTKEQRRELTSVVEPLVAAPGFTGRAPGGPSRWSTKRSSEWKPLRPALVCEVSYDHFSAGRFRHGTRFLRWRPEKKPAQCTFDQVVAAKKSGKI
ncbi:MAG: ATP-dependent DNA ligase [Acidobacteriales bacterium]|nr:ATP-dependent DNA ligase [Terriglobales bacterium]